MADPTVDPGWPRGAALVWTLLPLSGYGMYADVVFVREGRALGFYTFVSVGAPSTLETTVLAAVVGRLAAAQA